MDPWFMGPSVDQVKERVHQNMDQVHEPPFMDVVQGPPIFATPYKQRLLLCLIAGSYLHVFLPVLSFMSNMANVHVDKNKLVIS